MRRYRGARHNRFFFCWTSNLNLNNCALRAETWNSNPMNQFPNVKLEPLTRLLFLKLETRPHFEPRTQTSASEFTFYFRLLLSLKIFYFILSTPTHCNTEPLTSNADWNVLKLKLEPRTPVVSPFTWNSKLNLKTTSIPSFWTSKLSLTL